MIRKLRLKFVAVCMLLVTAVLMVVFASVYTSARHNILENSRNLLQRVITEDASMAAGRPGIDIGSQHVQLPYFAVEVWGGDTAYVTGGTYSNLEDTQALQTILNTCLSQNKREGVIPDYDLRYLRQSNGLFQRLAFVDMSMEKATLRDLMQSYLQIGLAALVLLLGVSVLLSYWATHPVEIALRQQRQFLSDASHELKTPLTVILSNAELLGAAPLDARPARWADNIQQESQQMKHLVEEMLTLARADNMVRTSVFGEVALSDLATDCALLFEPVAFEAGKPLSYEITAGADVIGDGDKLRQVVSILLDNAIKYGEEGKPIFLRLQKTEKTARLQVTNQGPPIPPEQLSRLFERFYRADASRGEKSGFGLGLAIASAIAVEHKGTLRAESDDTSTRFILTLPLKK